MTVKDYFRLITLHEMGISIDPEIIAVYDYIESEMKSIKILENHSHILTYIKSITEVDLVDVTCETIKNIIYFGSSIENIMFQINQIERICDISINYIDDFSKMFPKVKAASAIMRKYIDNYLKENNYHNIEMDSMIDYKA